MAGTKRAAQGWQFMAAYSATKSHVPFPATTTRIPYNPNAEINVANNTWEWMAKFSGGYDFPLGIASGRRASSTKAASRRRGRCS